MSLIADHISLCDRGDYRLRELSCEIPPGRLTVIIGPNGSGKTSLIKVLAGELAPTAGKVSLEGRALKTWPLRELATRRAVMPQHARLDFPFRVRDVIGLGRSPYPRNAQLDQRLVDEALALFDIAMLAGRMYTTLSGGERQRVHLARTWVQISEPEAGSPRYLLLDEPGSALDLKHQRDLMALLQHAVSDGALGVVMAIHDLNSAARYADQLLLLDQGRMVAQGARSEVMTLDNITQTYRLPVEFLYYTPGDRHVLAMPNGGDSL